VHHTNEIAQVEAATGKKFVRFWLHGEFLVIDKGKMAKSGDNFITMDSIKEKSIEPLAYRMFCFTAHYRSPLAFSWEGLSASANSLANLKKSFAGIAAAGDMAVRHNAAAVDHALVPFWEAICDDINIPRAMAVIWELAHGSGLEPADKLEAARKADEILGLDLLKYEPPKAFVYEVKRDGTVIKIIGKKQLDDALVNEFAGKIIQRKTARAKKDFAAADAIRDELTGRGVAFKDKPDGTTECIVN